MRFTTSWEYIFVRFFLQHLIITRKSKKKIFPQVDFTHLHMDDRRSQISEDTFFHVLRTLNLEQEESLSSRDLVYFSGCFFDECKMGKQLTALGELLYPNGRFHVNLGIFIYCTYIICWLIKVS